jgi:toxin YoeB
MKIAFTESGWNDYLWFLENDRKMLKRINLLIKDVSRSPFEGIGKPEALKGDLSGHCRGESLKSTVWSTPPQRVN